MIKTKNILKIGVFSIVILSLLISPILKSNVPEVHANGDLQQTQPELWSKIQTSLNESSAVDICDKAFPGGKDNWAIFTNSNEVVQHAVCVFQIGAIEGLGKMFNATINWGIAMTLWAIEPATFGGFVTNKGVTDVGKIIRDFINLFLILGLVFIGIATILGIKKYSWQQTLWKLVIVALLVNFSVIISGMILDVSYFFTYNFLNLAKANNDISVAIKSGFNASSTMDDLTMYSLFGVETGVKSAKVIDTGVAGSSAAAYTTIILEKGWGLSWGNFLITAFGMILIGLFALIALIAIFVTMILRACIIIALLCLSPIAFAAWIFPDTEKYWKMWWEQFIKWCTFPVIFSLMLYMGITVMNGLFSTIGSGDAAKLGMIAFGIRMVLFSMFLVAGLIFSIQGGGAAAQFVMKQGSKLALGLGSAGLGFGLGKFMNAGAGIDKAGKKKSSYYDRVAKSMSNIPLIGNTLTINLYKAKAQVTSKAAEKINKEIELIKNDADALDSYFAQSINALGKMKAIVAKAKSGLTLTDQQMDWYSRYGGSAFANTQDNRDIQKAIPVLRDNGTINIDELIQRTTPTLQNREASEKLLSTNVFDYINTNRNSEFNGYVQKLLQRIGTPRQLENWILSIRVKDRTRILKDIDNAVGHDMTGFLQTNNSELYKRIKHPSAQDFGAVSTIQQYLSIT